MLRAYGMSSTAEIQSLSCLTRPALCPRWLRPAWDPVGDDVGNPRPLWWPGSSGFPGSSPTACCVILGKELALSEPRCHYLRKAGQWH